MQANTNDYLERLGRAGVPGVWTEGRIAGDVRTRSVHVAPLSSDGPAAKELVVPALAPRQLLLLALLARDEYIARAHGPGAELFGALLTRVVFETRAKLARAAAPVVIVTEPGLGYRLVLVDADTGWVMLGDDAFHRDARWLIHDQRFAALLPWQAGVIGRLAQLGAGWHTCDDIAVGLQENAQAIDRRLAALAKDPHVGHVVRRRPGAAMLTGAVGEASDVDWARWIEVAKPQKYSRTVRRRGSTSRAWRTG
jgi:hypothetical protein